MTTESYLRIAAVLLSCSLAGSIYLTTRDWMPYRDKDWLMHWAVGPSMAGLLVTMFMAWMIM